MARPDPAVVDAIVRVARRHGIDPSEALAIAERESSFDVNGRAPGSSAFGLFQLLKAERAKYGGNSTDPEEQADAWARYIKDVKAEMAARLGRQPTAEETYLGHYVGGGRAARLATGQIHPETPMAEAFTPQELAANPNMVRAGTTGAFASSVMADIARRRAKWGGDAIEPGPPQAGVDLSQFGEEAPGQPQAPQRPAATSGGRFTSPQTGAGGGNPVDLSEFGEEAPANAPQQDARTATPPPSAPGGGLEQFGEAPEPIPTAPVTATPQPIPTAPAIAQPVPV